MMKTVAALLLMLSLLYLLPASAQNASRIVLPNTNLLRCSSSGCSQLWSADVDQKAIFPKQVIVDTDRGCIYGMTALYDKSLSFDLVKSALDNHYRQWSGKEMDVPASHAYIWRVPQKLVIQITVDGKEAERKGWAEAGTKRVRFLAIGGRNACSSSSK
ncbi:MAG: hypothetical protein WAN23_04050 [Candidatus Acidiferrales bacterium]